jgi:hypothetical protein
MAATWSESASRRSRINGAPHRCEIAPIAPPIYSPSVGLEGMGTRWLTRI